MKSKKLTGNLILLATAVIWGTAFAFQRAGMDSIEPVTFNASRMTLAAVAVSIVSILINKKKNIKEAAKESEIRRSTLTGGICCGIFLAAASIFQQAGMVYTSAGKAGFITAMYILLVPIISFVIFKKRYGLQVWGAVLLGIAGMYLLCMTEGFSLSYGDSLVCVCAVLFSGHILCCDHFVGKSDPVRMSAIQFITASLISWTAAFIMEEPSPEKIISATIPILYCGLISGGIGYTLQIVGQKYTEPATASLIMSLEAVFAVIGGALILGEKMSSRELTGCVVMFIAMIIVQLPEKHVH